MGTVNNNDEPAGKGVFFYRDDDKDGRSEYQGSMFHGKREDSSKATLTYRNGNCYEGTFLNDMFKEGTLWMPNDGLAYVGTFYNKNDFDTGTLYRMTGDRKLGEKVGAYQNGAQAPYVE